MSFGISISIYFCYYFSPKTKEKPFLLLPQTRTNAGTAATNAYLKLAVSTPTAAIRVFAMKVTMETASRSAQVSEVIGVRVRTPKIS